MTTLTLGLLLALVPTQPASALDPAKAITQYVHSVWRTDDGLPESSVTKILETSDGYLWVGTQAGLARFDGVRFTVFDHTNTPSLHNDYILDLAEDRQGTLWIATSVGGVTSFHEGRFTHMSAIGDRAGLTLAADVDGSVWIGGYGGLTHLTNGGVIRTFSSADGLAGDPVRRVVFDKNGSLWIATPGGLNRVANGKIETYSTRNGLPSSYVIDVHPDADGTLLIQTQNSELTRWANGRFEPWHVQGIPGATVSNLLKDRDGNFWLASESEGLARISAEHVTRFTSKDGLSGDQVKTLYEDRDGNLWVGTTEGGLDRFRDGRFTTYAKEEGLAADQAYAVTEDHAGDIWVTTASGLNQLHDGHVRVFTTVDGLPTNSAWSLREDHAQNLWIGTAGHGAVRMTNGHVAQILSIHDGIPASAILGILEDADHRLWLATKGGGLVQYADGQAKVYSMANGMLRNFAVAMVQDLEGTLWIGTNGGLNSIRDGHIKSYTKEGLANAAVFTLHVDAGNTLWIGTLGRGLFRLGNGRLTHYAIQQGLPDDSINNILEDASSNLWIGSNKGIFRISRHDLDAVAAGASQTVQPIVFGKADGMKSSETNSGVQPSGWRARDGRLWFPTIRGVTVVDPARLSFNDHPPTARVEEMLADEAQVNIAERVRLAPGTHRVAIRYTAPSLSSPERTRFRYRLDGFDEHWVSGGTQRIAQYTNLSPGHYTFHVTASAETGRWAARDTTFDFELLPQFYQTWWFRLLCGLAGVALLWGAYRLRVNWLHARAAVMEERQRIAGEIHDNLAQSLSGIVFKTEAALLTMKRKQSRLHAYVLAANELAKSSLREARSSVWNLSPMGFDKKELLETIIRVSQLIAGERVDALRVESSGIPFSIPARAENHVVRIVQEAVSNAIEHGHAHSIAIDVTYSSDGLRVDVVDDGEGFHSHLAENSMRGFGMKNMHHRAAQLGANLDVTSVAGPNEAGHGTRVSLRVPRGNMLTRLWRRIGARQGRGIDG